MIKLERTGMRALRFEGKPISIINTRKGIHNRWHAIVVYETAEGKLVLQINYRTQCENEDDHYVAKIFPDHRKMMAWIRKYDPCEFIWEQEFEAIKNGSVRDDLRHRFDAAVSELLIDHPEVVD